MAALRAPRRSVALLATVLLAGLVPVGLAEAATTPSLQVSNELTVTAIDIATITAKVTPAPTSSVTINFEILDGPGDNPADGDSGNPDKTCVINPNNDPADSCDVDIRSGASGTSLVRAWINGQTPDTAEGRLSKKGGLLGLAGAGDCTSDDGSGGLFGGNPCEEGTEQPGTLTDEPDYTDVVS